MGQEEKTRQACKPGSVPLWAVAIHLARAVTGPAEAAYPRVMTERATPFPLLGFAPGEVYRALPVTGQAVGSYPTFSPFLKGAPPERAVPRSGLFSVALSVPPDFNPASPGITRHHTLRSPDFPLPTRPLGPDGSGDAACLSTPHPSRCPGLRPPPRTSRRHPGTLRRAPRCYRRPRRALHPGRRRFARGYRTECPPPDGPG